MKMMRDEQGRLVFVEMIDGVETVVKIIPKHEEQLYLRRGSLGDFNNDYPSKAEADKMVDLDFGVDILMPGGEVDHYCNLDDEVLPEHPEAKEPEKLEVEKEGAAVDAAEYSLLGINLDPGEDPEEEPVEKQK